MGYMKIQNLYKSQDVLLFREVYALEKIHGTSARVQWRDGHLSFASGGAKHSTFVGVFDTDSLAAGFADLGHPSVVVFGEAYGGKQQGMSDTYGKSLRFVAFEVKIGDTWLAVPQADDVATKLGLEFVHYRLIPATVEAIDAERDAPSVQARRNGIEEDRPREGVVLRPPIELRTNNGERLIAKHKVELHHERKNQPPPDVDPEKMKVLTEAAAIADEWVVPRRLEHVLQDLPDDIGMERVRLVIDDMVADVYAEAKGEIVEGREVVRAISRKTVELFKQHLMSRLADRG